LSSTAKDNTHNAIHQYNSDDRTPPFFHLELEEAFIEVGKAANTDGN
jgi:hypothetical protein